jgi:hypothetical protein
MDCYSGEGMRPALMVISRPRIRKRCGTGQFKKFQPPTKNFKRLKNLQGRSDREVISFLFGRFRFFC